MRFEADLRSDLQTQYNLKLLMKTNIMTESSNKFLDEQVSLSLHFISKKLSPFDRVAS